MNCWQCAIKIPFIFAFVLIALLRFTFLENCSAQNFTFESGRKKDAVSFTLVKNLIIIPIFINNKGPFNFILDTGVNPLVITDPSLKDSLNITSLRPIKINGFGDNDDVDAFYSNNAKVNIGDAVITSIPTVLLKEDLFNLSNYLGTKIFGLIGFNFFDSFVVKINYINKRMIFWIPTLNKRVKGEKISLEFLDNKPYINAKIETEEGVIDVKLIVDCGASHALSLEKKSKLAFPLPLKSISANLGIGIGGLISGNIGRVNKLWLGKYVFSNVLTSFPRYNDAAKKTAQPLRNGNLGADVLKHFHVVYDYPNHSIFLQKNENFILPFEHDMSGMEIYFTANESHCVIGRIEKDSPADKAGLLTQDKITAINFKSIENYSLDEVTNLLKAEDGRTVIIEIWRNDRYFLKIIRLKRRI